MVYAVRMTSPRSRPGSAPTSSRACAVSRAALHRTARADRTSRAYRRAQRARTLQFGAFDSAHDAPMGIDDQCGRQLVDREGAKQGARLIEREPYTDSVFGPIFTQVLGRCPQTRGDPESARVLLVRQRGGPLRPAF